MSKYQPKTKSMKIAQLQQAYGDEEFKKRIDKLSPLRVSDKKDIKGLEERNKIAEDFGIEVSDVLGFETFLDFKINPKLLINRRFSILYSAKYEQFEIYLNADAGKNDIDKLWSAIQAIKQVKDIKRGRLNKMTLDSLMYCVFKGLSIGLNFEDIFKQLQNNSYKFYSGKLPVHYHTKEYLESEFFKRYKVKRT